MCTQILNENRYVAENIAQYQENYSKSNRKKQNTLPLSVQKLWIIKHTIWFFELWLKKDFHIKRENFPQPTPKTHSARHNQCRNLIESRLKHVYFLSNFSGDIPVKTFGFRPFQAFWVKCTSIFLKITPVPNSNLLNNNLQPKNCRRPTDLYFLIFLIFEYPENDTFQ